MDNSMRRWIILGFLTTISVTRSLTADATVTDGVLGHLVGSWQIGGTTMGKPTITGAEVRSEFGGTFLELHIKDPTGRNAYEARVFFGEATNKSLVVHWIDGTGGETSRTLGTGKATGDLVTLSFPYPAGEFRDRLTYERSKDRWRLFIETGPSSHPVTFSDWHFDRVKIR